MSWNDCATKNWVDCKFTDWTDCIWDFHSITHFSGGTRSRKVKVTGKKLYKLLESGRKPYMEEGYNEMMREWPDKYYRD